MPLYIELIRKKGIPRRNYSFVGYLGFFRRPEILRKTSVFVNPSLYENCSISILEAMSSGAAVVASDVGGNPELIRTGENGLLVPVLDHKKLAESLAMLLKDEKLNRRIGAEARRTVENSFSAKKSAEKTLNVYKQLMND